MEQRPGMLAPGRCTPSTPPTVRRRWFMLLWARRTQS
jgi:hypothetical protein